MGLKKNLALMGLTTGLRLLAGLISFSIVARLLGPEQFGILMFWFSVAMLLALVTNYGLTPFVLREIGINPDQAKTLIADGLTGKLILTLAIVFVATVYIVGWAPTTALPFSLLLIASVADSYSEFLNAGLRATGRFDIETKVATVGAGTNIAVVAIIIILFPSVTAAAAAYAIARCMVLFLTVFSVSRYFSRVYFSRPERGFSLIRRSSIYAADFAFQSLFGQIDSVVLNHFVGPIAVGLHQAGMKVFQGGQQAAGVLSNVFLPRSAALYDRDDRGFRDENQRLQFVFICVGMVLGSLMAVLGEQIVLVLFGDDFRALIPLMPFFGLLFFLRFFASAWGVVLTAAGQQGYRARVGAIQWVLAISLAMILVPRMANEGWLMSLLGSTLIVVFLYAVRAYKMSSRPAALFFVGGLYTSIFCGYFWF